MNFKALALLTLIAICGCSQPAKITEEESLGKIISAEVIPTSFNESMKMVVKTEKSVVVIRTIARVDIGTEAHSQTWDSGLRTVTLQTNSPYYYGY